MKSQKRQTLVKFIRGDLQINRLPSAYTMRSYLKKEQKSCEDRISVILNLLISYNMSNVVLISIFNMKIYTSRFHKMYLLHVVHHYFLN